MSRRANITRKTNETDVTVKLDLDARGGGDISTGIGFLDHLLAMLQKHSGMTLEIRAKGDLYVDGHHTVEDVAIVLGQALDQALGQRTQISRFGHAYCPMDECLARAVVDISGRGFLRYECPLAIGKVGEFEGELFEEFLRSFAVNAKITLHVTLLNGRNQHHALEAMTNALARALRMAVAIDPGQTGVPSTKGILA
jgi:imidazoleglycerol-phosphate dehydratase